MKVIMSTQSDYNFKNKENFYEETNSGSQKVNVVELMAKMKDEQAKDKKNNIILSAAAISAITVFGIILTL